MALQFEVDSVDGLDENIASLYQEHDGKYRLAVEGIDPADELKSALQKEREERKSAKERLRELEEAQAKIEEARAKEKGEFKSLWEKAQEEKTSIMSELEAFKTKVQEKEKTLAVNSVVSAMTKDEAKAEALHNIVKSFVTINEDGEAVYSKGGIEVEKSALIDELSAKYSFLVDGSKATGGAGRGSNDAGGGNQQINREEFDKLSQAERQKFFAAGGKVID